MPELKHDRIVLTLEVSAQGPPTVQRLQLALKVLLRRFGLRAVHYSIEQGGQQATAYTPLGDMLIGSSEATICPRHGSEQPTMASPFLYDTERREVEE